MGLDKERRQSKPRIYNRFLTFMDHQFLIHKVGTLLSPQKSFCEDYTRHCMQRAGTQHGATQCYCKYGVSHSCL